MNICLVGPVYPYRGGIAHFTTLLVKQLIQEEHNVHTISFKKQYPKWLYPGKSDKDFSSGREKVDADFIITPFNPFSWIKAINNIVDFHPEKLIIPWWVTVWGPCFKVISHAIRRKGIHVSFFIHNTLPHEAKFFDRFITRITLSEADQFIVMTEKEKQKLLTLIPNAKAIEIASHPIYNMFKPSSKDVKTITQNLGLPGDKKYVLFFGFVRPYKGLTDLLAAFNFIHQTEPQIHLIIAGEFWGDRGIYDKQILSYGLKDVVHIFDQYIPDDEVAKFFEISNLFVAPYTGGTQSGAVKTALGFGMPAVITDIIADDIVLELPDLISIVPSGNPEDLAKAILNRINQERLPQPSTQTIVDQSWHKLIATITNDD